LRIEKSLGYQLIALGYLRRVHIGRSSRILVSSIRDVLLRGVPPMPKKPKKPEQLEAIKVKRTKSPRALPPAEEEVALPAKTRRLTFPKK
jgi:hypothetical protein